MFEEICTFIEIVRTNSFTAAANKLGISPSVVTRRIKFLEDELEQTLIIRTTRQLTLTEAGNIFYEDCIGILDVFENSKKALQNLKGTLSGTLKIGIPTSIGLLHTSLHINQFLKKHPSLKLNIVNGNHLLDLLEDRFDLAIHCGHLPSSNFYYRKIGLWRLIVCAAPSYLKEHGTPYHPHELEKFNCLDHFDNYDHTWSFQIEGKEQKIFVGGNIRTNSSLGLKNLALTGVGIVLLPSFTVTRELHTRQLASLLTEYEIPPLDICAVYPRSSLFNKKVKAYINFLIECLQTPNSGVTLVNESPTDINNEK